MKNKNNLILIVGLFAFIMLVGGVSYSYFVYNREIAEVSLNTGDISIDLVNINGSINLTDVIPLTDYEGKNSENYLDFTVNATVDTEPILYEVEIIPKTGNTIDEQYIKLYLQDQEGNVIIEPFKYSELYDSIRNNGKTLCQDLVVENNDGTTRNYTKNYRLRIWIDEDYPEVTSKTFGFDINVYAINVNASEYVKATFDVQDGRSLAKYVKVNEEYGDLPTPVRDGYVFLGWNGKNLFSGLTKGIGIQPNDGSKYSHTVSASSDYINIDFRDNKVYYLSGITDSLRSFVALYDENYDFLQRTWGNKLSYTLLNSQVIQQNGSYDINLIRYAIVTQYSYDTGDSIDSIDKLNIQLEEGPEATTYEPYYVNNNVVVTRNNDHTLKAIWQENE